MSTEDKWLSVIGIEEDGLDGLSSQALGLINAADVIYGGARHLAMLGGHRAERAMWQSPFSISIAEIQSRRGQNVVVLATGDPQWFGIGTTLSRSFGRDEMHIIPARSAFSLAASVMVWSLAGTTNITLHGRIFSNLARHVVPGAKLLILTKDGSTAGQIAAYLNGRGFGESRVCVMEHLGGVKERIREIGAAAFDLDDIADFNIVAVECIAGRDAIWHARVGGLADDAFRHDGQLTKRVVRAATLSALAPYPGALLWDVGAGCGSIGIEWMRAADSAQAIAIETNATRCALITENGEQLGVPRLRIVEGKAPDCLDDLARPDAIFIGGGLSVDGMFEACWKALDRGGILVANAVTLESEARLIGLYQSFGGTLERISSQKAEAIGGFHGWQQARPVTQWRVVKPGKAS